jgi:hypothetical protein
MEVGLVICTMATAAVQVPDVLRRKWYQQCSPPSRKEAPQFDVRTDALQGYLWAMWQETRLHADLLRQSGIPVSVNEWDVWQICLLNPFKCETCMANGAHFNTQCCPSDDYRWIRDNHYIDGEDYRRMLRYCPPLPLTTEPPEWDDTAEDVRRFHAARLPL